MTISYLDLAPGQHVSWEFNISQDARGNWIADEIHGLAGGVFVSQKDAVRFALREANDDRSRVHVRASPEPTQH